mmetsp:Transcript_11487/g.29718  ORF Transcript_11487/g.29718 Transcript_11487/m.29718 type:complete len:213 (+) Transcript_11487:844-1482(+)
MLMLGLGLWCDERPRPCALRLFVHETKRVEGRLALNGLALCSVTDGPTARGPLPNHWKGFDGNGVEHAEHVGPLRASEALECPQRQVERVPTDPCAQNDHAKDDRPAQVELADADARVPTHGVGRPPQHGVGLSVHRRLDDKDDGPQDTEDRRKEDHDPGHPHGCQHVDGEGDRIQDHHEGQHVEHRPHGNDRTPAAILPLQMRKASSALQT